MNTVSIILLALIALALFAAWRHHHANKGKCGCGGSCGSYGSACHGCDKYKDHD